MPTEEDLRAAFQKLASHAPDTERVLAPLRTRETQTRRGWPRLIAPIAAAAAVLAVAGTSFAVWGGGQASPPAAGSSLLSRVPRYYMALVGKNGGLAPDRAVIRDTVTGVTVASVRPPAPFTTFSLVVAGANDRTFVLAARTGIGTPPPTRLYLARFDPAHGSIQLTPLPIAEFSAGSATVSGLAVSPNGTELAVALTTLTNRGLYIGNGQIRIYSLASRRIAGPVKVWNAPAHQPLLGSLSPWAQQGTLGFDWDSWLEVLYTNTPSGSLLGDSRLVLRRESLGDEILAADGTKIVAIWYRAPVAKMVNGRPVAVRPPAGPRVLAISVATGKVVSTLVPHQPTGRGVFDVRDIAWTNSSAGVVVGQAPAPVPPGGCRAGCTTTYMQLVVGSVGRHTFEPIPGAPLQMFYLSLEDSVAF